MAIADECSEDDASISVFKKPAASAPSPPVEKAVADEGSEDDAPITELTSVLKVLKKPAAAAPSPPVEKAEAKKVEAAVPAPGLARHEGAERDKRPAWMTKGLGIGTKMFGEATGDLLKPGLTRQKLEEIEARGVGNGPDPFGDVYREEKKPPLLHSSSPEPLDGNEASRSLSHKVAAILRASHDDQAASASFKRLWGECLGELQRTCERAFDADEFRVAPFDWSPDVKLEAFGSTAQGTALRTSDIDVRMSFEQFAVQEPARQLKYLKGVAKYVQRRGAEHDAASNGKPSDMRFTVLRFIDEARLPVLRLIFAGRLEVDLTMGHEMAGGAALDLAVHTLLSASIDDGAACFVRLVKAFAKTHRLVDAYGGYLNSLSWVLLAINFLQFQSALPPYQDLQDFSGSNKRALLWPVRLTASLFLRFFAYVEACSRGAHVVSVARGACYRGKQWSCSGAQAHPLFVENPCKLKDGPNLAQCLQRRKWEEITLLCEGARAAITSAMKDEEESALLARRLFELPAPDPAPALAPAQPQDGCSDELSKRGSVELADEVSAQDNPKRSRCA